MSTETLRIDHCICFNTSFAALKTLQDELNLVADAPKPTSDVFISPLDAFTILQKKARAAGMPFGEKCQRCHLYVQKMLQTEQVVFTELLDENS